MARKNVTISATQTRHGQAFRMLPAGGIALVACGFIIGHRTMTRDTANVKGQQRAEQARTEPAGAKTEMVWSTGHGCEGRSLVRNLRRGSFIGIEPGVNGQ